MNPTIGFGLIGCGRVSPRANRSPREHDRRNLEWR